jgi:hypothetical protein
VFLIHLNPRAPCCEKAEDYGARSPFFPALPQRIFLSRRIIRLHPRFTLFTALMRMLHFFTEGCIFGHSPRCYHAAMKKFLLATLLVMVVAAPAFAATKHHHHRHHHHHKA